LSYNAHIHGKFIVKLPVQLSHTFFFQKWRAGKYKQVWELVPVGGGENIRKGCRRVNVVEILCAHVENGKMRPDETIPGMEEEGG
jgi:hypothetical protein